MSAERRTSKPKDPRLTDFEASLASLDVARLRGLAEQLIARGAVDVDSEPAMLDLPPPPHEATMYRLRVDLNGAKPPVWRRLDVASDLTLDTMHRVLQVAIGWTDSHLHAFSSGATPHDRSALRFVTAFDLEEGAEGVEETGIRLDQLLREPGDRILYEYDFGDGWEHTVRLEQVRPRTEDDRRATCVDGRRACPPEDVGGVYSYNELVAVLAEGAPDVPEDVRERLDWLPPGFDPAEFDADRVNSRLLVALVDSTTGVPEGMSLSPLLARVMTDLHPGGRALVDELVARARLDDESAVDVSTLTRMVHPWSWLLHRIGHQGVKLTAAGYLPPTLVREAFDELGLDNDWIGKGNREDQTMPVLLFRESALRLGLVRKYRGRLLSTKLGTKLRDDPEALCQHIARRMPLGRDEPEELAGLVALLVIAAEDELDWDVPSAVAMVLSSMGWTTDRGRVDDMMAARLAAPTWDVLYRLGVVATTWPKGVGETVDAAGRAFARAALRA